MIADYPCPRIDGGFDDEFATAFDQGRRARLLIVPALFEEASRMRKLTLDTMRRLDGAGIDSFLPELPGCGESVQRLEAQTPGSWREAMHAAGRHFEATHVLAIRGGALVMPGTLPGWILAPVKGSALVRSMLRARMIAAREAGVIETSEALLEQGLRTGLELSGYRLTSEFLTQFNQLEALSHTNLDTIAQQTLGSAGLWLRAEPGEDRGQADALAAIIAIGVAV